MPATMTKLQWGHRLSVVETGTKPQCNHATMLDFNGATAFR